MPKCWATCAGTGAPTAPTLRRRAASPSIRCRVGFTHGGTFMDIAGILEFNRARAAGLSPVRAARWVAYQRMKAAQGQARITLDEAVRQVRAL